MERVVKLVLPAFVIAVGVVALARGFVVSEPNWPERLAVCVATLGLGLSLAAYVLGVRKGVALAGLLICLLGVG